MSGRRNRHNKGRLAGEQHPARRDGAVAAVLSVVPWVVALARALGHRLVDVGTVAVLASVSLTLPALWLTWAGYRNSRSTEISGWPGLVGIADQLAAAVGAQWQQEAAVRRLNDPYPLPVSWAAKEGSLADSWQSLVRLASSGAGWPPSSPASTWPAGPASLAGHDSDLADALKRVPTGRLVVLGEPGAGKTMLMVRLVLDLLARRTGGGPVPVLAPLPSWDPSGQDLQGWLADRLSTDYPALAAPAPAGTEGGTRAGALLAAGLIVPVLDGLDEIPESARGSAIARINDSMRPGRQLIVTCRTEAYRDAVRSPGGLGGRIRGAAVIEIRPLDVNAVFGYLHDDAPGPAAAARWAPVLAALRSQAPVGKALTTPLMAGLARVIYNPRPGEPAGAVRDPAELCDPGLADRAAVESLLFDGFIPAAYRPGAAGSWSARQVRPWLVYLAGHLEFTIGDPDLAWWQLPRAVPRAVLAIVPGLVAAICLGAGIGLAVGVAPGIAVAAVAFWPVAGLAWILASRGRSAGPVRGSRSASGLGLAAGLVILVLGAGTSEAIVALIGLATAIISTARLIRAPGVVIRADPAPVAARTAASPQAALQRDHRTALVLGGVLVIILGLTFLLIFEFIAPAGHLREKLAIGIASVVFLSVVGWSAASRWSLYLLAKVWLASRRRLPLSLMKFLADAHQRGILRQAGGVYQFRHIELQHHLAAGLASRQHAAKAQSHASHAVSQPAHPS